MSGGGSFRRILRLRRVDARDAIAETDEEIRLHVELRAAELMEAGLDEAAAFEEARRRFAREPATMRALYAAARERDGRMRLTGRLESLVQDVRYAVRGLLRDPGLSGFVVLTLALGIGANVTAWSLFDRLLLRDPAHVVEADRVMRFYTTTLSGGGEPRTAPWIPYSAYRQFRELDSFASVAAYRVVESRVGESVETRRLRVGEVLGPFFELLGVRPYAGTLFGSDAGLTGDVAVLAHDFWQAALGGDPDVVGRRIMVEDVPYTVVGVAPRGFNGTETRRVSVWVAALETGAGNRNWQILGRLRPGVTAQVASAEATSRHVPDDTGPFAWFREARIFAAPWSWDDSGRESTEATLARWLSAITAIILLIAFANVVSLLLVRVARRRRELAVRVSLGSGRSRVIRLIALEGVVLAVAGGGASLLVARVAEPILRRALFADQAGWTFAIADGRILALVTGIVLLTMLCVGTVPAMQAGSASLVDALRGGARSGSASARLRAALSVIQAALSVVLLAGAGLFLRSFANVRALDLGIDRDRVLVMDVSLPPWRSFDGTFANLSDMERQVYPRLAESVRRVPGVEDVAVAIGLPLDGGSFAAPVFPPGRDSIPSLPGSGPYASIVSPGYFATVGTRIVRGRAFDATDRAGSEPVVIVNETMARTLWPRGAGVGECIRVASQAAPCARVVGIAQDVHRTGLRARASFQYYVPLGQESAFGGAKLVVRASASARPSPDLLRRAIVEAEPAVRGVEVRGLDEALAGELRPLRIGLATFGISGALALVVVVLGLYSLMSYLVTWRTHEIGVRVALGATHANVAGLVLRSGILLASAGAAIGLILAILAGPWIEPHLFETSARDAPVLGAVTAAILVTAVVAGLVPARRAASIDPTDALRSE